MSELAPVLPAPAPPLSAVPARTAAAPPARGPALRDRLLFAGLLAATAALYLVGLSRNGWANQFYAAAAQAGSRSWTAFLFGSLDQAGFITVDKPPAALWVMDLSVRLFGVNSEAVLVPQALEGVAAVALLYAAVRRVSTPTAGLLAGAVLASTPVAALMFRFDNPDALLVLLVTASAYATIRAVQAGRARWLVLAGTLLGLAFLTKMMQGLLVAPGLAAAYLVAAAPPWGRRLLHVLAAGVALVVAAGWWIALVQLWPAGSRPYIGGTTSNSILELTFGYNGLGRLTGADNNGSVGGGAGGFSSGSTGIGRLLGSDMGTQIGWLLPAALVGLTALAWLTWHRPRRDVLRASALVWGGWLLVTGLVFSFASGIIHAYYTVALAPAIGALVGLGLVELWRARALDGARLALAATVLAGGWTAVHLLGRTAWHPELRWVVGAATLTAAALVAVPRVRAAVLAPVLAVALLAGPSAYAVQTAVTTHTGAIPSAGPAGALGAGGGPGGAGGGFATGRAPAGGTVAGRQAGAVGGGGPGGGPGGGGAGGGGAGGGPGGGGPAGGAGGGPGGGPGGLGGATSVSSQLVDALRATTSSWAAATTGDNLAASLELASGRAVMALGGYNGTDPAISLARFQALVRAGEVRYYVADPQGFIGSTSARGSTAYAIQQWVESTFRATTVGGTTVYDLTAGA